MNGYRRANAGTDPDGDAGGYAKSRTVNYPARIDEQAHSRVTHEEGRRLHGSVEEGRRLQRLRASAEQMGQTGSWELVPSQRKLLWSDNLYRIFGVHPGELEPSLEYVLARTHPDDRERVEEAIRAVGRGESLSVEYRITRPDGDRRHLRTTVAIAERRGGRPSRMLGIVQDLTDSRSAEREIAAHVAVAEALTEWEAFESGARRLLARLAAALDCVAAVFWAPRGDVLVARVFWHESAAELPRLEAATRARLLRGASALAGHAWEARKPLSWTLGGPATGEPGNVASDSEGMSGALAIPALAGEEVLAVVELRADCEIRVGERLMRSLNGIAHELGDFLARRRGQLAAPLLTPREAEILQLASQGLAARETAERLTLSPATVRTHLENIYRKLEVSDKAAAVATALRLGVID